MENTNQPEVENQETPSPELTLNDLASIRQIIDAAVRRGTFSASEISGVGQAYDKLNNFLNSVSNQQKQENA